MKLKTLCVLANALLFFSVIAHAQQAAVENAGTIPTFKLGLCYMPQSTFIKNSDEKKDPYANPIWTKGFMTGLTAGLVISEKVSMDFGFLYSKQGVNYLRPSAFYAPITLSYIKVPFVLSYRPLMKYKIPLEFSGGFQFSSLIKSVIDMPQGYYLPGKDKQWFNSGLFDVVGAVGFNFETLPRLYLITKLRVDYSLSDPINKDYVYNSGGSRGTHWKSDRSPSRNITLGFLIGLEYHFGKRKS